MTFRGLESSVIQNFQIVCCHRLNVTFFRPFIIDNRVKIENLNFIIKINRKVYYSRVSNAYIFFLFPLKHLLIKLDSLKIDFSRLVYALALSLLMSIRIKNNETKISNCVKNFPYSARKIISISPNENKNRLEIVT